MIRSDLEDYVYPAVEALYGNDSSANCLKLEKALRSDFYSEWYASSARWTMPISEELKHQLRLLAGPHGKTILKAIKARQKEAST